MAVMHAKRYKYVRAYVQFISSSDGPAGSIIRRNMEPHFIKILSIVVSHVSLSFLILLKYNNNYKVVIIILCNYR